MARTVTSDPKMGTSASVDGSTGSSSRIIGGWRMTQDQLEAAVLQLPASERARLAERLIASLDEDAELEVEWQTEAERRDDELTSGQAAGVPLDSALDSARARLR